MAINHVHYIYFYIPLTIHLFLGYHYLCHQKYKDFKFKDDFQIQFQFFDEVLFNATSSVDSSFGHKFSSVVFYLPLYYLHFAGTF